MSNQMVVNAVNEGIIDFNISALYTGKTVDEVEHSLYRLFKDNSIGLIPIIAVNVRRLFPTYLEHKHPSAFSTEARAAMSGLLFGLIVLEALPVDHDATRYMLSNDLKTIRNKEEFLDIGYNCLAEIDFLPETIPQISHVQSENLDIELSSGFGLVVANSIEAYDYQYNYAAS